MKYLLLELSGGQCQFSYNTADGTHTFFRYGESVVGYHFTDIRKNLRQCVHDSLGLDYDSDHREISLAVVYGIDVPDLVRKDVSKNLSNEALGQIIEYSSEVAALNYLCPTNRIEADSKEAVIFLYSDNKDLYVRLVKLPTCEAIGHIELKGYGQDPRVEPAAQYIYKKVQDFTECSYEMAAPAIRKAIVEFIADGRNELGSIKLPDCTRKPYFDRQKMEGFAPPKGANFSEKIIDLVKNQNVEPHDCAVVFQGFATDNSYFSSVMGMFVPHININKLIGDGICNQILLNLEKLSAQPPSELSKSDEGSESEASNIQTVLPDIPRVIIDEVKNDKPAITKYGQARKFFIKAEIKTTRSGFFKKKKELFVEVEIENDLDLPCNCALTIDDHNYKTFKSETVFEEMNKSLKGPFQFGPYTFPLVGIDKNAKSIYIHVYPSEKTFPMNLFRNNHKEISI